MKYEKKSIKKIIKRRIEISKMGVRDKLMITKKKHRPISVSLVDRDYIRRGIKIESNPKFSKNYIKREYEYDSVILITSYNRYDFLYNLLNQLYTQETEYKFKVIVVNDGSDDVRYLKLINNYPKLIIINNEKNYGKKLYWKTINSGLKKAKDYPSNTVLQIDDDFQLCDDFLDNIFKIYYEKKHENNKILCISFHLYDKSHEDEGRWGLKYWVDGGGLYDIEFIREIKYNVNEIPIKRWENNKNLSTGVWRQISIRINGLGCVIYKTPVSYVKHLGINSKMWNGPKFEGMGLFTYNFIDKNENIK